MKKEFIVERQGRAFVMYAGLLNLAHENGLRSIRTDLIQAPGDENGHVAICTATVILEKSGCEHIYTGIGDAAENNVAPAMRSSLIRMAETRAKARALRDAVNVGVSAFEELSEGDGADGGPRAVRARGIRQDRPPAFTSKTVSPMDDTGSVRTGGTQAADGPISAAQTNAIASLCRSRATDADTVAKEKFGADGLAALTSSQAGDLIRSLSVTIRSRSTAPAT